MWASLQLPERPECFWQRKMKRSFLFRSFIASRVTDAAMCRPSRDLQGRVLIGRDQVGITENQFSIARFFNVLQRFLKQ